MTPSAAPDHELLIGKCHFMYFIITTDNIHLFSSFFNLVENRILIYSLKGSNLFTERGGISTFDRRNRTQWSPWSTVEDSASETISCYIGEALERTASGEYSMSSFIHPRQQRAQLEKGRCTFLRNATHHFEVTEVLLICHLFLLLPPIYD